MTTKQFLQEVREVIDLPEKWTKGAYARSNEDFRVVPLSSMEANCFCIVGACLVNKFKLMQAIPNDVYQRLSEQVLVMNPEVAEMEQVKDNPHTGRESLIKYRSILVAYNDLPSTTHANILALIDSTIEGV